MNPTPHNGYPGARWWKVDFHAHTGASCDAFQDRSYMDEAWLLAFMRAGVDCVAITDHNSGDAIPGLQACLASMDSERPEGHRPLTLFPGVELTVQGGIHVLAIFDPSQGRDVIVRLLDRVGYSGDYGSCDGVTRQSLLEVVDSIHALNGLAIPAHVDEPKGLFTSGPSGESLRAVLKSPLVAAMELRDSGFRFPGLYAEESVRWARVLGSDTHRFAGSGSERFPGSHFTWVKMDQPCIDSLGMALRDGQLVSIRRSDDGAAESDPNQPPELWIESLEVAQARLMGMESPEQFDFSPWLNAIIGGRGSGKSTLIHFLRFVLRQDIGWLSKDANDDDRVAFTFKRFAKVGTGLEQGGLREQSRAHVIIRKGSERFRLSWTQAHGGVTVEQWESLIDDWMPASSQDVCDRFPVRLMSQDQIGQLAERPQALLRHIDQEIDVTLWRTQHSALESRLLTILGQQRSLLAKLGDKDRLLAQRDDLKQQLSTFEQGSNARIRADYQRASRQRREADALLEAHRELIARLHAFREDFLLHDFPPDVVDPDREIDAPLRTLETRLHASMREAAAALGTIENNLSSEAAAAEADLKASAWREWVAGVNREYAGLVEALKQAGVADPNAFAGIVAKHQVVERQLKELDGVQAYIRQLEEDAAHIRQQLLASRRELRALQEAFLENCLGDNRYIRIQIQPFGDASILDSIEQELRSLLGCDAPRFAEVIRQSESATGFLEALFAELPTTEPARSEAIIARVDEWREQVLAAASGNDSTLPTRFRNFLVRQVEGRPEALDRFRFWYPQDSVQVAYSKSGSGKDFQPLASGSPGERAAALLAFFLAHGSAPLVIDQPENDLDNHLITDLVVKQLRESKLQRQVIVVTHNPNIVVNADAEWVHAMRFRAGQCRAHLSGALHDRAVRNEVCAVMEGGESALKSRYQRLV